MLWGEASLELVQCLMLLNRYLHCAGERYYTWMTAGFAVRVAQGMCCHLAEGPASAAKQSCVDGGERELKKKVWAGCVAMDR